MYFATMYGNGMMADIGIGIAEQLAEGFIGIEPDSIVYFAYHDGYLKMKQYSTNGESIEARWLLGGSYTLGDFESATIAWNDERNSVSSAELFQIKRSSSRDRAGIFRKLIMNNPHA